MIQRKTQTAEYWQAFSLSAADIEFLHTLLLDAEQPLTTRALALALVGERCRREEAELRAELDRGIIYQPRKSFKVGDKIIFPSLDFRLGEAIELRPGHNPEYGDFEVVTVDFGSDRRQRSFAASLTAAHKLNVDVPDVLAVGNGLTPEKILDTVATELMPALAAQLAGQPDFAGFEDRWLLRDLLAAVHVGHLNIAEALIEMRTAPVATTSLLKELDLPAEIKPEILMFSLHSALAADPRFDQVGAGETRRWYLRRLEPAEALTRPEPLVYTAISYDRTSLPVELLQIEWELDDEWTEGQVPAAAASPVKGAVPSTTVLLTYPHLLAGTLPLNVHSRPLFPRGHGERIMITMIDGRWGQRFPAWVVPAHRYVAGLRSWFEQHKLPAGAFITLERRDNTGEIVVDFRPKRMRREWTRRALVTEDGRLDIQLRKQEVACEYDEQIIISDERVEDIYRLRANPIYAGADLKDLVYEITTDLAGLSQGGNVHAKTVYSAINVLRRCPPGPVFAILANDPRLQGVGDGLFRLNI